MIQKLVIVGAGGQVGRELVDKVLEKDSNGRIHENPTDIIGVVSRDHFLFGKGGLGPEILKPLVASRERALQVFSAGRTIRGLDDVIDQLDSCGLNGEVIFVDVTAERQSALDFHRRVIGETKNSLVTANKNPVALSNQDEFDELTAYHGRYEFNTTVMGGAGAVNWLQTRRELGEKFERIEGCFSGTLGYICSELEKGQKKFSEIVCEAKLKGYTEPNPWDDLNGLDVARKLVILARCAGAKVEFSDVEVIPFINPKYADLKGDEFLDAIREEDRNFVRILDQAIDHEMAFRYVAEAEFASNGAVKMKVGPKLVFKNSEFGSLSGTANLIRVVTGTHPDTNPHVIKSPGAGLAVTANSIREGIVRLLPPGLRRGK